MRKIRLEERMNILKLKKMVKLLANINTSSGLQKQLKDRIICPKYFYIRNISVFCTFFAFYWPKFPAHIAHKHFKKRLFERKKCLGRHVYKPLVSALFLLFRRRMHLILTGDLPVIVNFTRCDQTLPKERDCFPFDKSLPYPFTFLPSGWTSTPLFCFFRAMWLLFS